MAVKVLVPVLLVLVLSRWVVQKEEAPKSATDIQLDIDSQLSLLLFGIAVISSCRNTRSSLKLNFISSCGFLFLLLLLLFCDKNVEIIVCYHLWHITKTADNNNNTNQQAEQKPLNFQYNFTLICTQLKFVHRQLFFSTTMTPSTHVCYNNYVSITSILEEPTTIPGPHIQRSLCIQWLITWPLASATYCQFYYIRSSVCLSVRASPPPPITKVATYNVVC